MLKKGIIITTCLACFGFLFLPLTNSYTAEKLIRQAESYREKGRYLEALSLYNDINMNTWSEQLSATFYKGLADIYYEYLGDGENALALYRKLLENINDESRTASVYHKMARIYYTKGQRQKAIMFYKKILSLFPIYYRDNRIENELQVFEKGGELLDDVTLSIGRPLPLYVRILVEESTEPVKVSSEGGLGVFSRAASFFRKIPPGRSLRFSVRNNSITLSGYGQLQSPVRIKSSGQQCIKINNRSYRGFVWVQLRDGKLLVVNHVGLEQYLYGVLPREVSPSWHAHTLKAQAVAARTYALYHMVKREKEIYDVFSTTSSQVYGGKDVEHPVTQDAVDSTKGLILTYDGKIALTLYHANSGGETERADDVWGSRLPYLVSVEDRFSVNQPGFSWERTLSFDDIQGCLKRFGFPVTSIQDITVVERAASGRIKKLKISQPDEPFYLTGNSFRLIVGPGKVRSSNFEVKIEDGQFIFKGNGFGHGVGMSQWGAYDMAKNGYKFKEILQFYYPKTIVTGVNVL
jgi:stage II sporulation protein D